MTHSAKTLTPLKDHGRFPYQPITQRPYYRWPNQSGLAVYLGLNLEHFMFGEGMGARLGPASPEPDVLNYSWREYGNRVGAWRMMSLFDELQLPSGVIINTALYDHCPELVAAFVARGDELIGHGHTNSEQQGTLDEADEKKLLLHCKESIQKNSHQQPEGWLSPWISESILTPDLLQETGYQYNLNWCHDDQPIRMKTRNGQSIWSIPYPQELNDIPMIVARQMDAKDFSQMIIDNFEEMLLQSQHQPLVMGIALHPYLMGQPYRLHHLRKALAHIAQYRDNNQIWLTKPGDICRYVDTLPISAEK